MSEVLRMMGMTRTALTLLICSALSYAQGPAAAVTGTYHFTTPLSPQGVAEATTLIKTVASLPQVSFDEASATFTFAGPAEAVNFAQWVLPLIDKPAGDYSSHEYKFPSGDAARVRFIQADAKPQQLQEQITILRTVADVQKIFSFNPNRAMAIRGPEWQIAFSDWILDQLNPPSGQRPDPTPRAFTVGGPDFRGVGNGHQARMNTLMNVTSPLQTQEMLTVLRTVSDIAKVFADTSTHTLVLRSSDPDLARAEWIIQQLDSPSGPPQKGGTFTVPGTDDITRIFYLPNSTPEWVQSAVKGLRSEANIKKIFAMSSPGNIVVRGTSDQVAAAMAWLTAHNALAE
jgi:type II secretory pathway component GspD/PulD (secretin)